MRPFAGRSSVLNWVARPPPPAQLRASMNAFRAILLKLISTMLFAVMSAIARSLGDTFPVGQVVFFRSAAAIPPILIIYAWRRELILAVRTSRPFGHVGRGMISVIGMFLSFAALARIPLVDATTIGFASPLITVALSAIILKERVRLYRWTAVVVGFLGVLVMVWPQFEPSRFVVGSAATVGVILALTAAFTNAGSVIQTRRLTDTETTASIVFYFSVFCSIAGAVTLPFAWVTPNGKELVLLIAMGVIGGVSHILLTESYRLAPASLVAPFDYTALVWAFLFGFWLFGELPTIYVYMGACVVAGAGLFVIWRERHLGLRRPPKTRPPA